MQRYLSVINVQSKYKTMSHSFAEQLKQHRETILSERGTTITYKQREKVIENVPAVPTTPDYLNEKSGEHRTKHIDRAYTVEFGLLNWNGKQVIPMSGDKIIEGETVYEVAPIEQKQCYRSLDTDGMYVRIFVKR